MNSIIIMHLGLKTQKYINVHTRAFYACIEETFSLTLNGHTHSHTFQLKESQLNLQIILRIVLSSVIWQKQRKGIRSKRKKPEIKNNLHEMNKSERKGRSEKWMKKE